MKLSQLLKTYFARQEQREKEEEAQNAQQHLSGFDKQLISRGQSSNKQEKYDSLRSSESKREKADTNMLRGMKADWQKDSLGVRGNPVEMMRQQAPLDVPRSSVVRRPLDVMDIDQAIAAATPPDANPNSDVPQPPDNVPTTGNDPGLTPPPPPSDTDHLTSISAMTWAPDDGGGDLIVLYGTDGVPYNNADARVFSPGQSITITGLTITWFHASNIVAGHNKGYQSNGDGTFRLIYDISQR